MRPVAALLVVLAACASPGRVAEHAYPKDFRYLTDSHVNDAMTRLARATVALNELLRDDGVADRETVSRLLGEMDAAAALVDTQGVPTNHPILDERLGTFRADVAQAREAARRDPPNYYLAGAVTGACLLCHGPGRAP